MPYKHETDKKKLPRKLDRRVKLTQEDRRDISHIPLYYWNSMVAKWYWVHRKLIYLIRNPEQAKKEREAYKERRKDWRYYNKDKHRESIKDTRKHRTKNINSLI